MMFPSMSMFGRPRSARDAVMLLLSDRQSMSNRKLLNGLRNAGFKMTGQGMWKHLCILIEDGQILRSAHGEYSINLEYVRNIRAFCEVVERSRYISGAA